MRTITKLITSIVILLLVILVTMMTILSSSHGNSLTKRAFALFTDYKLEAKSVDYDLLSPFSLAITSPRLIDNETNETVLQAEYLSLNVSLLETLKGKLSLNNVLVQGTSLSTDTQSRLPSSLFIKHLALDNASYHSEQLNFASADIELSNWQNSDSAWGTWGGEFLFSAPNIAFRGIPLSNLLLDSEFIGDKWEVWGLSFSSPFANVTGSATLENNAWTLHQLTISDARIEQSDTLTTLLSEWQSAQHDLDVSVHRIDLLDISITLPTLTVEHLNLSAQSVYLKHGELVWAPRNRRSLLSFNASLVHSEPLLFTDVLADLSLSPSMVDVSAFSTKINDDGFVSLSGILERNELSLHSLNLSGLDMDLAGKWVDPATQRWKALSNVYIDSLSVRHTNLTMANDDFPIFVAGLNLDGEELQVRKRGHDGLWRGRLSASAKTASINRIPVSSPYLSMRVENGIWQLDPLNVSFKQGQLTAKAEIDLSHSSRAWNLNASGLSVPSEIYQQWMDMTLPLSGEHDIEMTLSGLASDEKSLVFSLSGDVRLEPQRTLLHAPEQQPLLLSLTQKTNQFDNRESATPIAIDKIHIHADRGRVTLSPVSITKPDQTLSLSGHWDLVTGDGDLSVNKRE